MHCYQCVGMFFLCRIIAQISGILASQKVSYILSKKQGISMGVRGGWGVCS